MYVSSVYISLHFTIIINIRDLIWDFFWYIVNIFSSCVHKQASEISRRLLQFPVLVIHVPGSSC